MGGGDGEVEDVLVGGAEKEGEEEPHHPHHPAGPGHVQTFYTFHCETLRRCLI